MFKQQRYKIEGMRCVACARMIQARLVREPRVRHAEVAYPRGTARVLLEPDVADLGRVIGLLEQAGYRITLQTTSEATV